MAKGKASHPCKIGQTVAVFALEPSGRPFMEGRAFIESKRPTAHHYRVRFTGEKVSRTRFINPDWQKGPDRSFELLREFWRASGSRSFDDFFPDI